MSRDLISSSRSALSSFRPLVERQPLLRRDDAARQADADHEAECLLQLFLHPLRPQVAVVLEIHAVEFEELGAVLADAAGQRISHVLGKLAAQIVAARLELLHR